MLFLSSALKTLYNQLYNNIYIKKYFVTSVEKLKTLKVSVVQRDFKIFTNGTDLGNSKVSHYMRVLCGYCTKNRHADRKVKCERDGCSDDADEPVCS